MGYKGPERRAITRTALSQGEKINVMLSGRGVFLYMSNWDFKNCPLRHGSLEYLSPGVFIGSANVR